MIPPRPTELAHLIIRETIRPDALAIDATAGNGHDTLFLARFARRVIAFDIQRSAIESTRTRIDSAGLSGKVELVHASHASMHAHVDDEAPQVIMFNLGYLPGEDHATITSKDETLAAITATETLLEPGGLLSVICYPGHEGGNAESLAVETRLSRLTPSGWRVARYGMLATRNPAPFLLIARKPGGGVTSDSP